MIGAALVKTEDRYFEEVAEGLDCRMRMFTPANPEETAIVLITWVPRPPNEMLEPCFSSTIAGLREGVSHLATSRRLQSFSLVEHHLLPEEDRLGLIVFGEMPDSPDFWQPLDPCGFESLIGESLEAFSESAPR
ncbi:MAG: hypothetical protein QM758_13765 [Armatimonas sp.]